MGCMENWGKAAKDHSVKTAPQVGERGGNDHFGSRTPVDLDGFRAKQDDGWGKGEVSQPLREIKGSSY